VAFKKLRNQKVAQKKYKHCKEQLEYTRKSLSTKNDELETAHSDIDFFKVRIIKVLNEVNKLCEGNNLFLPPEIERIQVELAVTDVIDVKETSKGFICVAVEECNR
jgi:hypothetical protein